MKRHAPANTPQEIRRLHESLPRAWAAEKWAKNVKDFAKAVLKKDPDALPGFYLKPRRYPREVRDKTLLYESVKGCLSPRELMECSKVHIKKIEEKWLDRMNETTGRTKYKLKKEFADMVARALEPEQWYNVLTRKGDDRVRRREALDQGERPETIRSLGVTKGVRDSHGHERRSAKNA